MQLGVFEQDGFVPSCKQSKFTITVLDCINVNLGASHTKTAINVIPKVRVSW